MISFWRQMRLLLWKGVLVKSRQKFWLSVELLVPLILFVILALVRTRDFSKLETQCHYESKGFPSTGILPMLHSLLCSLSNKCHLSPITGDETEYIHDGTAANESLLIDLIYYSSLQLGRMGENPNEFLRLFDDFTRLVKIIAEVNGTQWQLPEVQQFFDPSFNVTETLENIGLSENVAKVLTRSKITPYFMIHAYNYVNELRSIPPLLLPFEALKTVPFLCNDTIFNSSFILPPNTTLSAKDRGSLCSISTLDMFTVNETDISKNIRRIPRSDDPSVFNVKVAELLGSLVSIIQSQPLYKGYLKWREVLLSSFSNITAAIYCGSSPSDITANELENMQTGVRTPFDDFKDKLIKFIRSVVPGEQKHDKQFCNNVWIRDDLNCSSLETALVQQLRPLFTGYILVTPPSPIVKEMIDILNKPLRMISFLRQKLYEYPELSENLQNAFYQSDLRAATMNILSFLRTQQEPQPVWMKHVEFVLEHVFSPFSDPYSFGAVTKNITEYINNYLTCFLTDRFVTVANESDLEETAVCLTDYQQYFSGVVFMNMSENATKFNPVTIYKIRHPPHWVDSTYYYEDNPQNYFDRNKPFRDLKYLTYGFSYLQESIDQAITALRTNSSLHLGLYAQQEPYPCVTIDTFNITAFFALFIVLSFIIPASLLVKNIVYEKELRLKEQMRIMGLGDMVHLWSWAAISFTLNLASIFFIVLIVKFGEILPNVDVSAVFVFLLLFAISSIAMCLFLSTFFSNANISTAATCLIYFLFLFPYQLSIRARNETFSKFTLMFPQTALGYGAAMIATYNDLDKTTGSIYNIYLTAYNVSMIDCMVAFVVQAIVFMIFAWYKSAVSPGIYGISLPWYFFLTKRYWFPGVVDVTDFSPASNFELASPNAMFEDEPSDSTLAVIISGISKIYNSSGTKALDNLNLCLYEDQITALLGHNGAGKTTTMSILCGLYSPSSGTASIYGMDIRTEIQRVRDVLGVCPQYNVLFWHLTVAEQLRLFAALKGTPDSRLEQEVEEILNAVSLVDKANELAGTLSGGMKRRLCIGIALIGGSRFVILDEPTAGVDVISRKEIWTLLQNNKKGRTILLSTHHMDEADILSDRIAILSEGRLISLGSSVFLKNKYGESFQVIACKKDRAYDYTFIVTSITTEAMIAIRLVDETEDELVFSVPISTDSMELERFFADFDCKKDEYRIAEYGISAPTLQEIFVRLSPQREYVVPVQKSGILSTIKKKMRRGAVLSDQQELIKVPRSDGVIADTSSSRETSPQEYEEELMPVPLYGWELWFNHIKAILVCRYRYTIRSKKQLLFEVALPILLLLLCELYAKIQYAGSPAITQLPLPLIEEIYGNNTFGYISLWDRNPRSLSNQVMHSLLEPPDMGTRCVNDVPIFKRTLPTSVLFWIGKKKPKQIALGCDRTAGKATFNWNVNRSTIPYNQYTFHCGCQASWNCTAKNYPFGRIPRIRMNTTMALWDMSYRNISQMRMVSRWTEDGLSNILGGLSLGHISARARSPSQIQSEIEGWQIFVSGINRTAANLNVNVTGIDAPSIYDPFLKNMTTLDFISSVLYSMETKENIKAWFNNKMHASLPILTSFLSNALLRVKSKGLDPNNLGIITISHPMNTTVQDTVDSEASKKLVAFRIVLIMLVLCVIPAGFTVFLVEERVCDAFHLQLVSGLSKFTYWMTSYIFDMAVYVFSIILILMIYVIFQVDEMAYSLEAITGFFVVFFLYGMCAVLWAYILQRRFTVPALSFVLISVGTFFVGIVASLTVILIEQLVLHDPTLNTPHVICSTVFLVLPQYNLGMAIYRGSFVFQLVQIGENFLLELNREDLLSSLPIPAVLQWSLMGIHCACLIIHSIVAAIMLFIIEQEPFGFLRRKEQNYTKRLVEGVEDTSDDDVILERKRVNDIDDASDIPLIIKNLAKAYSKDSLAVRSISFAVSEGECFGLLGLNGAGKTTTFSILTQKILPGCGSVLIHGRRMVHGSRSNFEQVGYCPQFDALNMKLTTMENIELFARIRGVPENHIGSLVRRLLVSLHLQPYSSTITSELSGGNRRKLSVAIALINHPSLILLDEPSAGMDPSSQQFLWKVIDRLRKSRKSIVITSHSMEECEALCTRIAIMDRGQIRCIGSKQHLKTKFGEGHSLTVKMRSQSDTQLAAEFVVAHLEGAKIESVHCSTLFVHIDREVSSISGIYKVVNRLKEEFSVEDFSLSQSTLAEVFHSLATKNSSISSASSSHASSRNQTDLTEK